jgi:excisionase family DNA binding protein
MPALEDSPTVSARELQETGALYARLRSMDIQFAGANGWTQSLPGHLASFLGQLLTELKAGKPVTLLQSDAAWTTMAAARMLGVSRQFLVEMLERGQIPFHKVGTHRRVYARDVLAYKAKRDTERRRLLNELVLAEIEDGTYDSVPVNASPGE